MNRFFDYLICEAKRTLKFYPAIISFTLLIVLGISIILLSFLKGRSSLEENTKIKVGIVGTGENSYLEIGVAALQNMDTTRFYIEFQEMSEQEARDRLKTGELKGYISIPEGFVTSIAKGGDLKLTYVMGNTPAVMSSLLMQEIINIIGKVVLRSQSAIYGYMSLMDGAGYEAAVCDKLAENMAVEYLGKILKREEWYDKVELGVANNLSFEGYYAAAFIIIMFMLWGTVCVNMLTREDLSLQRMLRIRGQRSFSQIFGEYIPFFLMFCVNIMLLSFAASLVFSGNSLAIIRCGFLLIPAAFLISAMQFMLYEITSQVVPAVLLQMLSVVLLSYASGLFYPVYSLPETLQKIAAVLPTGVAFGYVGLVFTGDSVLSSLGAVAVYGAAFLLVSSVIRSIKIRGSRI